jgi:hypothetical protein
MGKILVTPGVTMPTGAAVGLILAAGEGSTLPDRRPEEQVESQKPQEQRVQATQVARSLCPTWTLRHPLPTWRNAPLWV